MNRLLRITPWLLSSIFFLLCSGNASADWVSIGPFGGDVRSLVADPRNPDRMYLGTRTGQVYLSTDGGKQWNRLTGLQASADWVVDDLLVDPVDSRILYAGMWSVVGNGGGVFKSMDGGSSWQLLEGLSGQFVRALALSRANPKILVAGTREGVFRSNDAGLDWRRISPPGHPEIRNLESLAMDPLHPEIIYVGTWHLPWKTADGGATWASIKKGMIDDSDVFSIIVDSSNNRTVYATACSGIYRSDVAGAEWRKIQGIPNSARRTHTLVLDPLDPRILYAGTTEGLWRTKNGGQSWQLLTSPAWVINAVVIDRRNTSHIYLGMDHAGVMESRDGGKTFQASNQGFAQRQVSRIVADPNKNGHFYVALLHDLEFGGVYETDNRGASWQQLTDGLKGRDVLSLLVVSRPVRKLLAGTPAGVFEYAAEKPAWQNKSRWEVSPGKPLNPGETVVVRDLYQRDPAEPIYAATSAGLFASADGILWKRLPLAASPGGFYAVRASGEGGRIILAATSTTLEISPNGGQSWNRLNLEGDRILQVHSIAVHPNRPGVIFVGTETGLFRSTDEGRRWEKFGRGVPVSPISEVVISPDDPLHIFVASSLGVFQSFDGGNRYQRLEEGLDSLLVQRVAIPPGKEGKGLLIASARNGLFFNRSWQLLLTHLQEPSQ